MTIKTRILFTLCVVMMVLTTATRAHSFDVATTGSDSNPGTKESPFLTIQHAADLAQPGDVVTVHQGTYRERINPPRGGTSDAQRITYQAAPGEKVVITGSEVVKNWEKQNGDTWKVIIPNTFFGTFNPFSDLIRGDWFKPKGGHPHTGCVYLHGDWLIEAAKREDVLKPAGKTPLWFGQADATNTTVWAQFPGVNPNDGNVEINVRQTVFTPGKTGINYITLRGFTLRDAATNWAPPSVGQIGLVTAYWDKGWIIENNDVAYSKCCGIALGKYDDPLDHDKSSGTADGYTDCVRRALTKGWNKETVGNHIVRNNQISHCEQAGIVGSLGCSFSTVTGNEVHDIHVQNLFGGLEMAGIKFHGAIDVTISGNHVYRCGLMGIWLDWMAQGAQVTGNLMHNNPQDIFCEMQHGPILLANNLLLSKVSLDLNSQGIASAHNLILGSIKIRLNDKRITPFQQAHSTKIADLYDSTKGASGDCRFFNNLFVAPGNLQAIDPSVLPCFAAGNVFTKGAKPSKFDTDPSVKTDFDPGVVLEQKQDGWYLTLTEDKAWSADQKRSLVTTQLLGNATVPNLPFENADGSPLKVDTDYLVKSRDESNPFPGPFEISEGGKLHLKVWP